tara:strand:+ start:4776 stop:5150 length:375 start_codon:yes stop_codon:yes gene_type:complete
MATYSNIFIDQGSTFTFTVDLNEVTSGADATLTDFVGAGRIRKSHGSINSAATFSIVGDVSGATTFTSSDKGIVVSLTAAETSTIKAGRYVYDIEIRKASTNEVNRVLEGQIEITPRVTLSTET